MVLLMYKHRHIEHNILEFSTCNKILLVTGARQVGKSTLLRNLFPNLQHITFDPIQDSYGVRQDPDLFLKTFPSPMILDEVQYVPELLPALKRHVDLRQDYGQYFLTGSQNFSMLKTISESLAGRVSILKLYPMTFLELYDLKEHWIDAYLRRETNFFVGLSAASQVLPLYQSIYRGGMPGLISRSDSKLFNYFESYLETYIERDVRSIGNIQNLQDFTLFVRLLAAQTAQEVNLAHLGRELGIANSTAIQWRKLLQATYLWLELPAYHGNAVKRIAKKSKGYILDTGLACHLQRLSSAAALSQSPGRGALFENYCVSELYGYLQGQETQPQFYHWRTVNQAEVDLILEQDGWLFPIEFKCKTTLNAYDARGIKSFRETYPQANIFKGVIIYAGDVVRHVTEDVIAIPWNYIRS